MSEHEGEASSELSATEEINVDDSDSRSCGSPTPSRQYEDCSNSPPPPPLPQTPSAKTKLMVHQHAESVAPPRSHPFSISRLLAADSSRAQAKSPGSGCSEEPERPSWSSCWEPAANGGSKDEDKSSDKDEDEDTGSSPEVQHSAGIPTSTAAAVAGLHPADLLAPFRLFPGASGLIYPNGVIRVPAHRPPGGGQGSGGGGALLPAWALHMNHSQQQQQQAAAAAGMHTARFLANLAAHPLQAHPHLKDRLAGELYYLMQIYYQPYLYHMTRAIQ